MSAQPTGFGYVTTYSGVLKLIEEALNITVLISLGISGYQFKTYPLNGLAIFALTCTIVLLILHFAGVVRKTLLPWMWIECTYGVLIGLLYLFTSTVALIVLTRGLILSGIFGYITGIVYFMDAIDKYRIAETPRSQYVWNVPDVEERQQPA